MATWMKSNSGMWHKLAGKAGSCHDEPVYYAKCQSYNLDRPNYLRGETTEEPSGKICKKCQCVGGGNN